MKTVPNEAGTEEAKGNQEAQEQIKSVPKEA